MIVVTQEMAELIHATAKVNDQLQALDAAYFDERKLSSDDFLARYEELWKNRGEKLKRWNELCRAQGAIDPPLMPREWPLSPGFKGPERGSPRVQAWVHSVLNPWIEALEQENSLLSTGDLTWRFYNEQFEFIRPMREYLAPAALINARDLVAVRPHVGDWLVQHDELRGEVEQGATSAYRSVVAVPHLRPLVMEKLAVYRNSQPPPPLGYPSGAWPDDKLPALVAERIVNHSSRNLGHPWADAVFWNTYGDQFTAIGTTPEVVTSAHLAARFRTAVAEIMKKLRGEQFYLVDTFDIQAAPTE